MSPNKHYASTALNKVSVLKAFTQVCVQEGGCTERKQEVGLVVCTDFESQASKLHKVSKQQAERRMLSPATTSLARKAKVAAASAVAATDGRGVEAHLAASDRPENLAVSRPMLVKGEHVVRKGWCCVLVGRSCVCVIGAGR